MVYTDDEGKASAYHRIGAWIYYTGSTAPAGIRVIEDTIIILSKTEKAARVVGWADTKIKIY